MYCGFGDPNNPSRVFSQYLEFRIDYSTPLQTGWVLTNYWGKTSASGRPDAFRGGGSSEHGVFHPTTFTNGHTYALVADPMPGSRRRIAELTTDGLRIIGTATTSNLDAGTQLESNGSMLYISRNSANTTATLLENYISSWSGNDPVYTLKTNGSVSFSTNTHPINYNYKLAANKAIAFQPDFKKLDTAGSPFVSNTVVFHGFHLGAITNLNATNAGTWAWTNAGTAPMNGRGNFDPNIRSDGYAGNIHTISGTNVFFGYMGEFWLQGARQANQFFHYSAEGEFLGQFGLPHESGNWTPNFPSGAKNVQNFSVVFTNGVYYLYAPDEGSHGLHRWLIQ